MRDHRDGAHVGSLIGAIAGLVFIEVNAGGTGDAAAAIRVAGVGLFLAALWWGVVRAPEAASAGRAPSPRMWRIYWSSVIAEVVAIPLGAAVLRAVDHAEVTVLWVIAVVGLHFLPFSRAFGVAVFGWLGAAMMLIAAFGSTVAIASGSDAAVSWSAVVAGLALLTFSVVGPRVSVSREAP